MGDRGPTRPPRVVRHSPSIQEGGPTADQKGTVPRCVETRRGGVRTEEAGSRTESRAGEVSRRVGWGQLEEPGQPDVHGLSVPFYLPDTQACCDNPTAGLGLHKVDVKTTGKASSVTQTSPGIKPLCFHRNPVLVCDSRMSYFSASSSPGQGMMVDPLPAQLGSQDNGLWFGCPAVIPAGDGQRRAVSV